MKNLKRAYRRYKKEVHLKRRARNYYDYSFSMSINKDSLSWADFWKEVKSGESGLWMRHTGKPCSCSMCSFPTYKRPASMELKKIIDEQIHEISKEDAVLGVR